MWEQEIVVITAYNREQHGIAITSLLKGDELNATAIPHHHNKINFDLYKRHYLGAITTLQRTHRSTHSILQVKVHQNSHVPTHLGRSSGQKDIPKPPPTARSRSRRNSTNPPAQHLTMVLRIRLARFGKKHAPFYNIVVAHAR